MLEPLLEFFKALYQYGIHVLVLVFIIFYLIFFPEKAEKLSSLFYRLFAFFHQAVARRYVALNIQSEIGAVSKKVNSELEGALPYGVKVKWIATDKVETEVKKSRVVIMMKDYRNQSINLARAALAYTHEGLLPRAREYVEKTLMKAIDYIVARKIVSGNTGSVRYLNEVLEVERKIDQNFNTWVSKVNEIDDQGYLTRIVFYNFFCLERLRPRLPDEGVYKETTDYVNLVHRVVTKRPEEDINPTFDGPCIRVAIVLIAKYGVMGIEPHLDFIKRALGGGIEQFHLVAAGKPNILLTELAAKRASQELPLKIEREEVYKGNYRGQRMDLTCITLTKL